MLSRISLKVKLVTAFLAVALLVVLVSLINFNALLTIRSSFERIVVRDMPRLHLLEELRAATSSIEGRTVQLAGEQNAQAISTQKTHVMADIEQLETTMASYQTSYQTEQLPPHAGQLSTLAEAVVKPARESLVLKDEHASPQVLNSKAAEIAAASESLGRELSAVISAELNRINTDHSAANGDAGIAVVRLTITAVAAAVLAILVGLLFAFTLGRGIKKLQDAAVHVASGDFNYKIDIKSYDELGHLAEAFNGMASRLKDSYQRIALEKQRDDALLESMGEGLLAVDQDGRVVLVNSVAVQLLELPSRQNAIGGLVYDIAHIYDTSQNAEVRAEQHPAYTTLHSGTPVSNTFGFKRGDGKKILLGLTANPVVLNGQTVGAIIIMRDVTKEKEVDRMKTEFISLASHQLRTPLSAIRWFTEMLLSGDAGKITAEQEEFTKNIYDSTQRMIDLVNSLLNISRIESGRIIIDPKPTDLAELINGIVNDLKAKTAERQQTLLVSVHKDLPKINVDPRLIGQVYLNFLTNAIKYTPKGGEISVFISRKGEEVVSQITDNGYGIPKEQQGRVFQKFFRAENIVKTETDGTGLGLYLVKAIIESSGGKVWFKSEEGKGTSFWFSIPMAGMKAKQGEVTLDA